MYSSSSESKRLVLVPILAVLATQLLLMGSVSSLNMTNAYLNHKCLVSQGKYKPGSRHEEYLNSIIKSWSKRKDVFSTGYSMMSIGYEPDMVIVTFQCRGDSYGAKCHSCFATAQSELRTRCPRYKGGLIWYDQCLVEISAIDTLGQINYDDGLCMSSVKNASSDRESVETKWTLIDNLTEIATTKKKKNIKDMDKPVLYAAGEMRLGKKKLYGMVQCTFDLSFKGCQACMTHIIVHFQDCYKEKEGARVLGRSCNFRFELYPFVNAKSPNYIKF